MAVTNDISTEARPDFFVIGAARSGTTALTEALRRHPEVFVTSPKEPHFLAFADQRVAFTGPGDDVTMNDVVHTELDAYLGLYRASEGCRARGEGSVSTLYYSRRSVQTLKSYFPDARLVAILRDPVERAFSSYQLLRARGFEPCADFDAALDLEATRVAAGWHHLWHYAGMGYYGRQLAPFVKAFGPERLLVLDFETLRLDPGATLVQVCRFLGVSPVEAPAIRRCNTSGEPRNRSVHRLFATLERTRSARRVIGSVVPRRARDWVRGRNLEQVAPPETAVARLRELYREDAALLSELLAGRPVSAAYSMR